jgi:amino acid adenylation domain-containing protein
MVGMDTYTKNLIMSGNKFEEEKQYWLEKLEGAVFNIGFPGKPVNRVGERADMVQTGFSLSFCLSEKINFICKNSKLNIFSMLLSGVKFLLYKFTGNEDTVLGIPAYSGNTDTKTGIADVLALRTIINNSFSYKEFLIDIKRTVNESRKFCNIPVDRIAEILGLHSTGNPSSLFKTFAYMKGLHDEERMKDFKPGMVFAFSQEEACIRINIEYDSSVLKKDTVESFEKYYLNFLDTVSGNPDIKLSEIVLVSDEEINKLLNDFNSTDVGYPVDKTVHGLFEEQVARTPEKTALKFMNTTVTYMQLNEKANQLAGILRESGAKPDQPVAIVADRSIEMITGILAVLKAGSAYVPIEPDYPRERIKYTLEDCGAAILLTQKQLANRKDFQGKVIFLDDDRNYCGDASNPENANKPHDLAYVIYTSGTTGKPKGVMIEHRNVVRLLFNDRIQFDFSDRDIWTMFHSYCFDFSVWELYGALLYGGTLVIVPKSISRSPREFLGLLENERVTVLNQTPSAFYSLVSEEAPEGEGNLEIRYVIFGGEALKPVVLKPWKEKYPETRFVNMYGITETTVHVTYKELNMEDMEANLSNIGRPIPTLAVYIMDGNLNLQPQGIIGELCVGGEGVGRGYLNRPELTCERFVENPYKPEERLYRSGDLARLLPNGEMEYLGRKDHQVKIRGHRIELGEIEYILLKTGYVKEALVISNEESGGDKYLAAYLVAKDSLDIPEIRESLRRKLPDYMIPAFFIQIDRIPITSNGKVDGKSLPKPSGNVHSGVEYVAPRNEEEQRLVELFREVLDTDKIGINDNFFDIGGNSILLIKLHSLLEEQYGGIISAADLFTYSTIQRLADYINNKELDRKIALRTIPMPGDFFAEGGSEAEDSTFELSVDGETIEKARRVSSLYRVQDVDVFLSVLIYMLSELSDHPEISIQTMTGSNRRISPLDVNTDEAEDFYSLLQMVGARRQNAVEESMYGVGELKDISISRPENRIALFFYDKRLLSEPPDLTDFFDLVFEMEEKTGEIRFKCEYDGRRLMKQKVMSMLEQYLKFIKIAASKESSEK